MFGLTNTWENGIPSDQEVVALAAQRVRDFKLDFHERIDLSLPIGSILEWPDETAPDGFLHCNGQSIAVASYSDLFAILGYRFGGSGANFNVPDMRGLFVRCWRHGKTGLDLDADAAVSCTGNISGTAITSITGLAGVPRLGALITGTGIPSDTYITAITAYDSEGIPTAITISQSATTGSSIAITIDNDIVGSLQYDENKTHSHPTNAKGFTPGIISTAFSKNAKTSTTGLAGGNEARPENIASMFIIRSDTL